MKISILIPVYRFEPNLAQLLVQLETFAGEKEIICAVAAPNGEMEKVMSEFPAVRWLRVSKANRGVQLAAALAAASGTSCWILHADSRLVCERDYLAEIRQHSSQVGFFSLRFSVPSLFFRLLAQTSNFRARRLHLIFGDQGLFAPRAWLEASGGIPLLALMEDWELSRKLRKYPFYQSPLVLETSARRFLAGGKWRVFWKMQQIKCLFLLGVPPEKLAAIYRKGQE